VTEVGQTRALAAERGGGQADGEADLSGHSSGMDPALRILRYAHVFKDIGRLSRR